MGKGIGPGIMPDIAAVVAELAELDIVAMSLAVVFKDKNELVLAAVKAPVGELEVCSGRMDAQLRHITTTPNELCARLHNRLPVILKPEAWVFDWSGAPTVHLRPTFFSEWLILPWVRDMIVDEGVINLPFGEGRGRGPRESNDGLGSTAVHPGIVRKSAAVVSRPSPIQ